MNESSLGIETYTSQAKHLPHVRQQNWRHSGHVDVGGASVEVHGVFRSAFQRRVVVRRPVAGQNMDVVLLAVGCEPHLHYEQGIQQARIHGHGLLVFHVSQKPARLTITFQVPATVSSPVANGDSFLAVRSDKAQVSVPVEGFQSPVILGGACHARECHRGR